MTPKIDMNKHELDSMGGDSLFQRVVAILEQARENVVRAVNSNMVLAYWLIGREIVEEVQEGEKRAEYGKQVIEKLSEQLTDKFGKGFSAPTLWNFRQFYQTYSQREPTILSRSGRESTPTPEVHNTVSQEILSLTGRELTVAASIAFNSSLSWSHYRALMRVSNTEARDFYEKGTVECGWTKIQLERQIQTSYYERILLNKGQNGLLPANRERLPGE